MIRKFSMKYSNYSMFSTDCWQKGLDAAIKRTVDLGFDAVEHIENVTGENWKVASVADAKEMRKKLDDNGLSVSCYSALAKLDGDNGEKNVDNLFRHIEFAAIVGSPFVHHTLVPGYDPKEMILSREEMLEGIASRAAAVAKRCNEYGIVCLYEPQGLYFNAVEGVHAIIDEMRARGCEVGVCGDTGNSIYVDCMPTDIFSAFKNDIKHVHIKDYRYGLDEVGIATSFGGKIIANADFGNGNVGAFDSLDLVPDYDSVISFEFAAPDEEVKRVLKLLREKYSA